MALCRVFVSVAKFRCSSAHAQIAATWYQNCSGILIARRIETMTDLMNLGFLLLMFGTAVLFVHACDRLK